MSIPHALLSLVRDPVGLGPLEREDNHLVNTLSQRRYPIIDSIPVLLDESGLGPRNRQIKSMYRWMSSGFDLADRLGNLLTGGSISRLRRLLAERLALKPGNRCLYTSIGTGLDLPYLGERVRLSEIELVGLDLSLEMLRQCQKKLRPIEQTTMLVQANAERLPFPDHAFDVVFHVGGINLFDQPAAAVKEMARVARPGALVLYADESQKVIREHYQKWNPFTRAVTRGAAPDFDPSAWVPAGVGDVTYEDVWKGKGYMLSFRAPP
jgi:ubiquinone/menaquinone biosynthesis C-methylase UbiE